MLFSMGIFLLSFFLRASSVYKKASSISTDEAFHLYYINLIRENNHSVPLKNPKVLGGPSYCTYPSFYHKLLSYLPIGFLEKYGSWSSLIYDTISILFLGFFEFNIGKITISEVLLLSASYLIFPSLTFHSIGPRSYSLTPRNFSQFLCTLGGIFFLIYIENNSFACLQVSALFLAISLISSKFSVQYLAFLTVVLSIVYFSIFPFFFFLNSLFWAFVLDGKNLFRQLEGHVRHSYWYISEGIKFIEERWEWGRLFRLFLRLDFRSAWQLIVFHNPVTRGVLLNFPIFLLIILLNVAPLDSLQFFAYSLILASVFLWLLTQFSIFRAFGEPERYLEFSLPMFFYLLYSFSHLYFLKICIVLYSLIFYLYNFHIRSFMQALNHNNSIDEIKSFLSAENITGLLCTLNNETYLFARNNININILMGFFSNNIHSDFYGYFYEKYPDVNVSNLKNLCSEYNVSHVVMNKSRSIYLRYNTIFATTVFENEIYKVLKVK